MFKSFFQALLTSGFCATMLATASYGESAKLASGGSLNFDDRCSHGEPFATTLQIGGETYEVSGTLDALRRETIFWCPVFKLQGSADPGAFIFFDELASYEPGGMKMHDALCDQLVPGTHSSGFTVYPAQPSEVGQTVELDAADRLVGMTASEASQLSYYSANNGYVKMMELDCKRGF